MRQISKYRIAKSPICLHLRKMPAEQNARWSPKHLDTRGTLVRQSKGHYSRPRTLAEPYEGN